MKKLTILSLCTLISTIAFAEGQAGLEIFFFGLFASITIGSAFIGGSLILIIRRLLKYKNNKKAIILSYSIALVYGILLTCIKPFWLLELIF